MTQKIDLTGEWQFRAANKSRSLPLNAQRATEWMPAIVPGTVHTDLMSNNIIQDPFFQMNELDVQWVDAQQWVYRKEFESDRTFLSERNIELVAEGIDTYARIRINGKSVAQTSNMFVEHRLDVKRFLKPGKNVIEILFDSPVVASKKLEGRYGRLEVALEPHRVYVRKAQYSFGWDWGPRLTTSGIWKGIYLTACSHVILNEPFVRTISVNKGCAVVECSVGIEGTPTVPLQVRVAIADGTENFTATRTIRNKRKIVFRFTIPNPKLWWPNGCGAQPMYRAMFSLVEVDRELDSLQVPFAIRTVRLLQERDGEGKSFVIEINGVKIFCKGADWIPCDTFLPRVLDSTYETLLTMAQQAHMNMIRVWGGGIYEKDIFYDLCDRLGLMVWQDFMFACGEYPEQTWFLEHVEDEARKMVVQLRNHPSIVLWCGNNECEWNYCVEHPGKTADDMSGTTIFRDLLPAIVKRHDGARPYWRSSPFGTGSPNSELNGNHHQWQVWSFWKDYSEYENSSARFVSEFGFQAPANARTYDEVTLPDDRHPQSIVVEHHNKQVDGTERLYRFQAAHVNVGTDFEDFIYKGQLIQAAALKTAVEHWRRRKFKTAGALFWQLNDCWPVSSWSVIDSALRPKAAYFVAKRFFAPVLVSFRRWKNAVEVWATNDRLERVVGEMEISSRLFDGTSRSLRQLNVVLRSNSSKRIASILRQEFVVTDPACSYLFAQLTVGKEVLSANRFYFVEPKHMRLPEPIIQTQVRALSPNRIAVSMSAPTFAKSVCLWVETDDAEFDDNFFDLDAGIPKDVLVGFSGESHQLEKMLKIKSLTT